jgi:hypothetical protein
VLIKKGAMNEAMLREREAVLADTVDLMAVNERFGLGLVGKRADISEVRRRICGMNKADRRASGLAAQFRFGWRAIQRHSGKSALLKRKAKREEMRAVKAKAEAEEFMRVEKAMKDSLILGWEIKYHPKEKVAGRK